MKKLNSLQTNAQVLEQIRKTRGRLAQNNLPEMRSFTERAGVKVSFTGYTILCLFFKLPTGYLFVILFHLQGSGTCQKHIHCVTLEILAIVVVISRDVILLS